jgi:THO complex subunit 2
MSGIDPLQMLADNQVAAMGGGPVLQTETVASETRGALQAKPLQRSADKLLSAMYSANLMLPMLVLLGRLSQQCVYGPNATDAILKGLGSTFDDVNLHLFIHEPLTDAFVSYVEYSFNTSHSCHFHQCLSGQLP